MRDFSGKIAVITGGGTGMGRALAQQLVAEGCDVAMCDVSPRNLADSVSICQAEAAQGVRLTAFECDVADEAQMQAFARHVTDAFDTGHINLLFNNAGIGGGGSFLKESREQWERTFSVCWGGVYNGARAFMPLLVASSEGHIINTSSINGLWASTGPHASHTAYSAAKFAVRGFTEALITDLRLNAPHVKASVVFPGHVGTSIMLNTDVAGADSAAGARTLLRMMGQPVDTMSDDEVVTLSEEFGRTFRDKAPTTATQAARLILEGVRAERWRILIGRDAHVLDEQVRLAPDEAYEPEFVARWIGARQAADS